ncbi:MAG: ABC transporter substrate-binding protein [Flavobacteriales bacterium]
MGRQTPWGLGAALCCVGMLLGCGRSKPECHGDHVQFVAPAYAEGFVWWSGGEGEETTLCIRQPRTGAWLATVSRSERPPRELTEHLATGVPHVQLQEESRGVTTSTTHVHLLDAAGALGTWRGCTSLAYLRDERVLELADAQGVADVKGDGGLNAEAMAVAAPTWVLVSPAYELDDRGWPLIPVTEYLEPHPLGRAEWMVALSWLAGDSVRGVHAFDAVKQTYEALVVDVPSVRKRVFTGSVADGVWHAPGKDSFVAKWIEDAGGTYALGQTDSEANVELGMESLLQTASGTDAWVVVTHSPSGFDAEKLKAMDPRHEDLLGVAKEVWVCNTAEVDYFGSMVAHPEQVLQDLRDMMEGKKQSTHGTFGRLLETRERP